MSFSLALILAQKEIEILKFLKSLGGQWEMKSINGVIQLEHILFRENAIDYCVSLHWKGRVQIYKPRKRPRASQKKEEDISVYIPGCWPYIP
jgi:hypothetical protein